MSEPTMQQKYPVGNKYLLGTQTVEVVGYRGGLVMVKMPQTVPGRRPVVGGVKPEVLRPLETVQ